MKSLNEYLVEAMNVIETTEINEATEKWFRLDVKAFDVAYESLKTIADQKSLYNEPIDNGIKIKVKDGQAELLESIVELLTELVNTYQEKENFKDAVEKLSASIMEMDAFMEDAEVAAEKAKEEADKAAEEEKEGE